MLKTKICCVVMLSAISFSQTKTSKLNLDVRRSQSLTWEQSISRQKSLSPAKRQELIRLFSDQLRPYTSEVGIESEEELHQLVAETAVKLVDLNGDGTPEIVAQPMGEKSGCSPTGNCPFWIFIRQNNQYRVLLDGEAQSFALQKNKTNGFVDVVLSRHGSAFESELRVYKFDGNVYQDNDCYMAEFQKLGADGEYHETEEAIISPCNKK